ncbi:MAG TPA: sensor domain-containing diguanylate cyclase [Solirubrobacterales bacterium]|nr:sensor domain-containing diguanylate cyclase [Solirubrobacterales bacterium]
MSKEHEGYESISHYRSGLLRFGLPYVIVASLAFSASLLGNDETNWLHYSLGWIIALSSLGVAMIKPQFWMIAPFGALAGALLIRSGTDGLDSGLGPLLMIPAIAVAVYGSRHALFAMIGSITSIVILIEIFASKEPALSPAWRQDTILVLLATVLAIAIQDLVTRMRVERSLAAERGRQIEQLNSITKAIATSANGGQTLCSITTEVTEAVGAALFHLVGDDGLELIASQNGKREMLRQVASGPALTPRSVIRSAERRIVTSEDSEMNLQRMAWVDVKVGTVVWEPVELNGNVIGALALAYGPDWESDEESFLPIDLLAAEGTIAIQQNRVTEQLELLATTDPLTGIDNRRGWEKSVERSIARARRQNQPLCLALLDLDHFKEYNDNNGHQAGDQFLQACALAWQSLMRADDHIARYGGEEFVLTLPDTELAEAIEVVERLRAAVPSEETCSGGIAMWDGSEPIRDLVRRADEALYLAKENGRNLSIAADPRPGPK